MAMAWRGRRSSKCDMSTWTDKTVSAVRDLEKSLNSKDYQVDLVRVARAYVGAIEYGIFVAQKGYNIASTSITTLGGPTGKELLSPQDKQEAFESVRAQAEKGRELTQDTLNRFNQVHGDIESLEEKFKGDPNLLERIKRLFTNTHFDLLRTIVASLEICVACWSQLMLAANYVADMDLTFPTSLKGWIELKDMYVSYTRKIGILKPKLDRLRIAVS